MRGLNKFVLAILLVFGLSACTNDDPGPLKGTWKMNGAFPMTVQFRDGESETMGIIEKVSYEIKGNQVLVTLENGPMKGMAARYVIANTNTVTAPFGALTRLK